MIFYTTRDYLVFCSILSVFAKRYGLPLLGVCLMPDHFHLCARPEIKRQLFSCLRDVTSCYVKEFNRSIGRKGELFDAPYGSAPKIKDKRVRENIAYLYNNPVEKELCDKAEEYPWNFLAYAFDRHPFSKPFIYQSSSWNMKKAIRELNSLFLAGQWLRYSFLERTTRCLSSEEKMQLTDIIIKKYLPVDFDLAVSYYGNSQKMLDAIHSNTGTEHDIREVFDAGSDRAFYKMADIIQHTRRYRSVREVIVADPDEKIRLFNLLQTKTNASARQIAKFLHMDMKKER